MSSGLKMAKASEADIKELSKYLQRLEKKNGATFQF
jgi:cytochrome c553